MRLDPCPASTLVGHGNITSYRAERIPKDLKSRSIDGDRHNAGDDE